MDAGAGKDGYGWVVAVLATIGLVGLTFGASSPLVSALLEEGGASEYFTASVTVALAVSIFIASPIAGRLVTRHGVRRIQAIGIVGQAVGFAMVGLALEYEHLALPVVRFALGVAGSMCWVATEVALLAGVRAAVRGRVMALYGMSMTGGFTAGVFLSPRLFDLLGTGAFFAVAAFSVVPLVLGLSALRDHEVRGGGPTKPAVFPAWGPIALALAGSALFGFVDTAMGSQFPVEGQRIGLSRTAAVDLVGFVVLGELIVQLPAGWLSDRRGAPFVLGACSIVGVAAAVLAAYAARTAPGDTLHSIALLGIGGAIGAAYPASLKLLGDRVTAEELPVANGRFAAFFGVGAFFGPLLAAGLVDVGDRTGLLGLAIPTAMGLGFAVMLPLLVIDRRLRA